MKNTDRESCFNPIGLAAGSILALIVAMAISLVFDVQPAEASSGTKVARTNVTARA